MSRRPLYVHIGASKTGTSSLQRGLFSSVDSLAAAGVGVPLVGRPENIVKLLRPLGWVTGSGFVERLRPLKLEQLAATLAATKGDRLLISNEDLAEAEPAHIEAFRMVAEDAGLDLHVVLTLRDLASVIPSEWQQFLRHRLTVDYPTFLEQIRDREGRAAEHFWQRQDAEAICERWAHAGGKDALDVIVVPRLSDDPDGVFRMFSEAVGFPDAAVKRPPEEVNASLGYVEAEVYRRLNLALGDRLPDFEKDYQPGVRRVLVQGVLARGASERITLPPEHVDWVRQEAERQRASLEQAGYRVRGDAATLVPAENVGRPLPSVSEEAVAAAAIDTLASFAVFTHNRGRKSGAGNGKPGKQSGKQDGKPSGKRRGQRAL